MNRQREELLSRLHNARGALAEEDMVLARVYVPEQTTRAALILGINALGEAINTIALLAKQEDR